MEKHDGLEEVPIFSLEGVCFSYPGRGNILENLNLSLLAGQKVGLYGPNGSGKTTLLRCITGLNQPQKGKVFFHGKELRSDSDFRPLRLGVGFVLQNAEDQIFFPTVLEDVAFGPLNLGLSEDEAKERALLAIHEVGLDGFEERLTHRLSGGEKKLVSLAGVLAMRPEALLLDEPTAGLDFESEERLIGILRSLDTARITISHNWEFLAKVSDTFCTIDARAISWKPLMQRHSHVHVHPLGDRPHTHDE